MTTNLLLGAVFVAALLLQVGALRERDYFSSVKKEIRVEIWKPWSHGPEESFEGWGHGVW